MNRLKLFDTHPLATFFIIFLCFVYGIPIPLYLPCLINKILEVDSLMSEADHVRCSESDKIQGAAGNEAVLSSFALKLLKEYP